MAGLELFCLSILYVFAIKLNKEPLWAWLGQGSREAENGYCIPKRAVALAVAEEK